MQATRSSLCLAVVLALSGCGKTSADLTGASALKIGYTIGLDPTKFEHPRTHLELKDPKQVREILATFQVEGEQNMFAFLVPSGTVGFVFKDGSVVETFLVKPGSLQTPWAMVYLKPSFYEKLNEVLSKHEGRAIDILTKNFTEQSDLRIATSMKITYSTGGKQGELMIDKPSELRPLLDTLRIHLVRPLVEKEAIPKGVLEFTLPDGRTITTAFVAAESLQWSDGNQLLIEKSFHKAVNELLSKHEGRPIDVLKDNP